MTPTDDGRNSSEFVPNQNAASDRGMTEGDIVSIYLKEIHTVPLLTQDEEIDLAQRIALGREAELLLLREEQELSAEEQEPIRLLISDGEQAREHLIKANTRLVVAVAKHYANSSMPLLDMIQDGNLGLIKAIERFDYTRGVRFSTYATWWIRQAITRAVADQGRTIRVPIYISDQLRVIIRASRELEQELGRPAQVSEISERIGVSEEKINWVNSVSQLPVSLEMPINSDTDEEAELGSFIEDDKTPSPQNSVYDTLLGEKIADVLETLPVREAQVIRMRFGLEDKGDLTLEEVGARFGLTRERIRQIEKNALGKLRHPRRSNELKDYL